MDNTNIRSFNNNVLHIYSHASWHVEVYIVGTMDGLSQLRDAINRAISDGQGRTKWSFVNDGEGYEVRIIRCSTEQAHRLTVPYIDDYAKLGDDQLTDRIKPFELDNNKYKN